MNIQFPIAALVLMTFAHPGEAQTTSNTNCWVNGRYVNCSTTTQPDYMSRFNDNIRDMQDQLQRMREAEDRKKAAEAQSQYYQREAAATSNRDFIRQRVGQLATSGDCVNARNMASANGEFELHSQVDAFCKSQGK